MRVSAAIQLETDPAKAWSALIRWEEQTRWIVDAARVRVVSPRREGVGVKVAVRTRILGLPLFVDRMEVVAWEPPGRLALRHVGLVGGVGEWTLEPARGGTTFVWREDLHLRVPLVGELVLLAYRPLMLRLMRASLERLRRLLAGAARTTDKAAR